MPCPLSGTMFCPMAAKCIEGVCGYERSNDIRRVYQTDGPPPMRRRERSNDSTPPQRQRQKRMGRAMAKGKRAVQEAATYTYATRSGQVKLMEELLLSIRRRVKFAQD